MDTFPPSPRPLNRAWSPPASTRGDAGSATSRSKTPASGRAKTATSSGSACASPHRACCSACRRSSACTIWPSRTRARRISIPRSSSMARRCSSSRAPPRSFDGKIAFGETHLFVGHGYVVSVRHGASTSYARGARAVRSPARPAFRMAKTTSSTRSSTSSSTTTRRWSKPFRREVEATRGRRVLQGRCPIDESSGFTCLRRDLLRLAQRRRRRWSMSAAGSSMPR